MGNCGCTGESTVKEDGIVSTPSPVHEYVPPEPIPTPHSKPACLHALPTLQLSNNDGEGARLRLVTTDQLKRFLGQVGFIQIKNKTESKSFIRCRVVPRPAALLPPSSTLIPPGKMASTNLSAFANMLDRGDIVCIEVYYDNRAALASGATEQDFASKKVYRINRRGGRHMLLKVKDHGELLCQQGLFNGKMNTNGLDMDHCVCQSDITLQEKTLLDMIPQKIAEMVASEKTTLQHGVRTFMEAPPTSGYFEVVNKAKGEADVVLYEDTFANKHAISSFSPTFIAPGEYAHCMLSANAEFIILSVRTTDRQGRVGHSARYRINVARRNCLLKLKPGSAVEVQTGQGSVWNSTRVSLESKVPLCTNVSALDIGTVS